MVNKRQETEAMFGVLLFCLVGLMPFALICDYKDMKQTSRKIEVNEETSNTIKFDIDMPIRQEPRDDSKIIWEVPAMYPVNYSRRIAGELDATEDIWYKVAMPRLSNVDAIGWVKVTKVIERVEIHSGNRTVVQDE